MVHVKGKDDSMVANNLAPHYLTHPGEGLRTNWNFVVSVSADWHLRLVCLPVS